MRKLFDKNSNHVHWSGGAFKFKPLFSEAIKTKCAQNRKRVFILIQFRPFFGCSQSPPPSSSSSSWSSVCVYAHSHGQNKNMRPVWWIPFGTCFFLSLSLLNVLAVFAWKSSIYICLWIRHSILNTILCKSTATKILCVLCHKRKRLICVHICLGASFFPFVH